jgi:hypothetical protein
MEIDSEHSNKHLFVSKNPEVILIKYSKRKVVLITGCGDI